MMDKGNLHGYVFTSDEVVEALHEFGCTDTRGLPVREVSLGSEKQMEAVRGLLAKKVIRYESEKYSFNEPFEKVFRSISESDRTILLLSKDHQGMVYICKPCGDMLILWEMEMYNPARMTLYISSPEETAEMLLEDGFIPRMPDFCTNIPEEYGNELMEAVSRLRDGLFGGKVRISFAALERSRKDVKDFIAVSSGVYGSVLSTYKGGSMTHMPYGTEKIKELLIEGLRESC